MLAMQVIKNQHMLLVTLLLCNAAATEVRALLSAACEALLDRLRHVRVCGTAPPPD